MILRAGFLALAQKLQEATTKMCTGDVYTRLADCLNDTFRGTGNWCYVVAVFGDDKSGDVVYSCNSDLKKAGYKIGKNGTTIDTTSAVDVQPLTTYESESAEMLEAGCRNSSRDLRQLQTIHDTAASLGANCSMAESHRNTAGVSRETQLSLVESAETIENIVLREARADYEIKLIAPGKGSSAFYPAEVLKRDGPSVFKEGTHVYLNHATRAEEAERPEGDVKNLAGVLSKGAYWVESHAKGPGLYGRMKVFADHAQIVEEKAAHVGMSIRANGEAVMEAGRPLLKEGLPTLSRLTSAESVDVVTRAGAGGMILTESAVNTAENQTQEAAMDAAELTKLQESIATANAAAATANAANAKLLERALKGDAREAAQKILSGITLPESSKARVIDTVLREALPKTEAGELDTVKFTEAVNAEAKREGVYVAGLTGSGQVIGMGTPGEATPAREAEKPEEINARGVKIFERLGHTKEAAERAVKGRVA